MNFGQLLGGAGAVARGYRRGEESARQSQISQLQLEEQQRLAALRAQMAQMDMASFQPAPTPDLTQPLAELRAPPPRYEVPPPPAPAAEPPILGGVAAPAPTPDGVLPSSVTGPQLVSRVPARPTAPFGQAIPNPQANERRFKQQQERIQLAEMRVREAENALASFEAQGADRSSMVEPARQRVELARQQLAALRQGLQQVAPTLQVPAEADAMATFSQLEQQYSLPSGVLNAIMLAESGGRPGQTSRKGAQGFFQFMPETAKQYNVQVNDFTSEAEGAARMMSDLFKATNGDLRAALAAYNWGIGNVQKKGLDKLPRETQEYISRVRSLIPTSTFTAMAGGQPAGPEQATETIPARRAPPTQRVETGTDMFGQPTAVTVGTLPGRGPAPAAPAPAPTPAAAPAPAAPMGAAPTAAPVQVNPEAINLADPRSVPFEQQRLLQNAQQQMALLTRQRNDAAQLAQMYMRSGTGAGIDAATRLRESINQLDAGMLQLQQQTQQGQIYLQGMQGVQEFQIANDPRRLAAVWSQYAGVPIGIQPRSDGKFNIIVNGQRTKEGLDASEITNSARLAFDQTYRQQQATALATVDMERFKARLEMEKENAKQFVMMIRDIRVEQVKGTNAEALEWAKANYGWDIRPTGEGNGTVIIRAPGRAPVYFNPTPRTEVIDGVKVETNAAIPIPIPGMPSPSGVRLTR